MKSSLLLSFVSSLVVAASALFAAPGAVHAQDLAQSCPVSLHALQGSGSGLLAVRDAKPTPGPSQHIHLVLADTRAAHVVSAKVAVSGLTGQKQVVPTRGLHDNRSDATRTLDVRFVPEGDNTVAAELALPGFTSVRLVSIQSIAYDDGSTWSVAAHQACQVAPDPLMLVADR